jgi:hypothetical protein
MCRVDFFDHEIFQSVLSNVIVVTFMSNVFLSDTASLIPCCSLKYRQLEKSDSVAQQLIGVLTTRSKNYVFYDTSHKVSELDSPGEVLLADSCECGTERLKLYK